MWVALSPCFDHGILGDINPSVNSALGTLTQDGQLFDTAARLAQVTLPWHGVQY